MAVTKYMTLKEKPILFKGDMVRAILEDQKTETRRIIKPSVKGCTVGCYTAAGKITDVINVQEDGDPWINIQCPYGQVSSNLWVRETACIAPKDFAYPDDTCIPDKNGDLRYIQYRATDPSEEGKNNYNLKWTPSIFMPRWASRVTLEITERYPERLQDMDLDNAINEGINQYFIDYQDGGGYYKVPAYWINPNGKIIKQIESDDPIEAFMNLWDSINAKPKPKKKNKIITHYESYPWDNSNRDPREIINGVPHLCYPNPLNWVIKFKRIEQ